MTLRRVGLHFSKSVSTSSLQISLNVNGAGNILECEVYTAILNLRALKPIIRVRCTRTRPLGASISVSVESECKMDPESFRGGSVGTVLAMKGEDLSLIDRDHKKERIEEHGEEERKDKKRRRGRRGRRGKRR